jgi:hypothetical protein
MLTPLAHQDPIFYLPKFELLIRTPYFVSRRDLEAPTYVS